MSSFQNSVLDFSKKFNLSFYDKLKIYLCYPAFKACWIYNNRPEKKRLAEFILYWSKFFTLKIKISSKYRGLSKVSIRLNASDIQSFKEIFWGNEYDHDIQLDDCESFIDCGANNGMVSFFLLHYAPLSKIILIEANPQLIPFLSKNLKGLPQEVEYSLLNICVSGQSKESVSFYISNNHRLSSMSHFPGAEKVNVSSKPLRQILAEHSMQNVDILKMDIEGAEFDILESDPSVFQSFRYLFLEIHGDAHKRGYFLDKICDLGFEVIKRKEYVAAECETTILKNI